MDRFISNPRVISTFVCKCSHQKVFAERDFLDTCAHRESTKNGGHAWAQKKCYVQTKTSTHACNFSLARNGLSLTILYKRQPYHISSLLSAHALLLKNNSTEKRKQKMRPYPLYAFSTLTFSYYYYCVYSQILTS